MIKVTFLYPNDEGSRFDMDYYRTAHLDLSRDKFGIALKGLTIGAGTAGINPGSKPPFHAVAQLLFDTIDEFYSALIPNDEFYSALIPNIEEFKADALKYTDVEPLILISESVV